MPESLNLWGDIFDDVLLNGNSVGIAIYSMGGELLFANASMCSFLKTDARELNPRNNIINPQFSTWIAISTGEKPFKGLLTIGNYNDESYVLEARIIKRDGRFLVIAEANVHHLFDSNRKMGLLNQEVNNLQRQLIKEKKSLQGALEELKKTYSLQQANLNLEEMVRQRTRELEIINNKLRELNIEKNKFIGIVAHDLRNPIGTAFSFSDLLLEDFGELGDEEKKEFIKIINERCSYSLNLITEFLDLSKIEAGIFELKTQLHNYTAFVTECVKQNRNLAKTKFQDIVVDSGREDIYLYFDKNKMEQVLNNLLSNAIKYSHPGTTITVSIGSADGSVFTRVKDQGQGIHPDELKQLFNPYQTAAVKSTGNEKSTGLGLAIVKKIIEAHSGDISVNSAVGSGSEFLYSLPHLSKPPQDI